ncbi:MAG: hypothetical protein AB8F94_20665 [Saprospiraceae bacterium]
MNALRILQRPLRLDFKEFEGLNFAIVKTDANFSGLDLSKADGIFIENESPEVVSNIIKEVRSSEITAMYLKPLFIKSLSIPTEIVQLTDGRVEDLTMNKALQKSLEINERVKGIHADVKNLNFSESLILKTTQYIYTRQKPLVPFRNRVSKIGYSFPFLSGYISVDDHLQILDNLSQVKYEEYFKFKTVDKVNLCHECEGTYMNFREVCPSCNSLELKTENLIHHFRCAYIGPESDFKQDEDMVCPKCDKLLRHIGIDYDKPSEINQCQTCNHQSQDVNMRASCIDCGHDMDLEHIANRAVQTLQITAAGEKLAIRGFGKKVAAAPTYEFKTTKNYFGWGLFKILVGQELTRLELRSHDSHFGVIQLNEEKFDFLDEKTKDVLQKEILNIVSQYLRPVDLISYKNFSTFAFLMPESDRRLASEMKDMIDYNLKKLIGDNIEMGSGRLLEVEVLALDPDDHSVLQMLE